MKILLGTTSLVRGEAFGEYPIGLKISGQRTVQVLSALRGQEIRALDRGNLKTVIEFRVRKKHKTAEEAQIYALKQATELNGLQDTFLLESEPSHLTYSLKNAVVTEVISTSNGNTSEHAYRITGGSVSEVTLA